MPISQVQVMLKILETKSYRQPPNDGSEVSRGLSNYEYSVTYFSVARTTMAPHISYTIAAASTVLEMSSGLFLKTLLSFSPLLFYT